MIRRALGYIVIACSTGACGPHTFTPTPEACWPGAHTLTAQQEEACELAADLDYDRGAK